MASRSPAHRADDSLFDPTNEAPPAHLRRQYGRLTLLHNLVLFGLICLLFVASYAISGLSSLAAAVIAGLLSWVVMPGASPGVTIDHFHARPIDRVFKASPIVRSVQVLAARAGLKQDPRVFGIHTASANAFAAGMGGQTVLMLSDGLMRAMSPRHLTGILAHEIAHVAAQDLKIATFLDTLVKMICFVAFFATFMALLKPVDFSSVYNVAFFILLLSMPFLAIYGVQYLSRLREFRADLGAIKLTGDPRGLAEALARVEYVKVPVLIRLFGRPSAPEQPELLRTHPSTQSRINQLMHLL